MRISITAAVIDAVYRREAGRVLATLIRLLGDFDTAEEARQEAFAAAIEQWPQHGVPENPLAWLISTGRNKAIDGMRRNKLFRTKIAERELASAEAGRFLRQLGRLRESGEAYRAALRTATLEPERRFLQARIAELEQGSEAQSTTRYAQSLG